MSLLDLDEPTHRTAKQTIKYRYIVIDFVHVCEIKSKQQIRQFNHDQLKKMSLIILVGECDTNLVINVSVFHSMTNNDNIKENLY